MYNAYFYKLAFDKATITTVVVLKCRLLSTQEKDKDDE